MLSKNISKLLNGFTSGSNGVCSRVDKHSGFAERQPRLARDGTPSILWRDSSSAVGLGWLFISLVFCLLTAYMPRWLQNTARIVVEGGWRGVMAESSSCYGHLLSCCPCHGRYPATSKFAMDFVVVPGEHYEVVLKNESGTTRHTGCGEHCRLGNRNRI